MQLLPFPLLHDLRRRMLIHALSPRDSCQLWKLLEALETPQHILTACTGRAGDSCSHRHSKSCSHSSPGKKPHKL